jgi:hypothetical protein
MRSVKHGGGQTTAFHAPDAGALPESNKGKRGVFKKENP